MHAWLNYHFTNLQSITSIGVSIPLLFELTTIKSIIFLSFRSSQKQHNWYPWLLSLQDDPCQNRQAFSDLIFFQFETVLLNSGEAFMNMFLMLFYILTMYWYVVQICKCKVKVPQHSVHYLLEDCWRNLDSERKTSKFVQTTMCVDTEQLTAFFLHHYLKICVTEVDFWKNALRSSVQSLFESYKILLKWYLMPPCLTLSILRYG